ncbi:MAG: hypothetical protein AB7O97_20130 [Planctomycetota bacterium]
MTTHRPIVAVGLAFAAPLAAQVGAPRHLLRMAFEPGKAAHYRKAVDTTMKVVVGGRELNSRTTMTMRVRAEVLEVKDGAATMRHTVEHVTVKMDGPKVQVDYDSADPGASAGPLRRLEELVGEWISVRLDDRGRCSGATASDGFPGDALAGPGGSGPGGSGLDGFVGEIVPELPDEPVAVGETWRTAVYMPVPVLDRPRVVIENTLVAVGDGRARIRQVVVSDADAERAADESVPVSVQVEGVLVLDLATGMPAESEVRFTLRETSPDALAPATQSIAVTMRVDLVPAPANATTAGSGR